MNVLAWESPRGLWRHPSHTPRESHSHCGPRRDPPLTSDDVLYHLVPEFHSNLAPLASGIQKAGQDDHRCQGAQRLLRATGRDPQQPLCFSRCQGAQDCLTKDVPYQVDKIISGMT